MLAMHLLLRGTYCPGNICMMSGRANRLKKEASGKLWRVMADWATRVDNEIKEKGYATGAIGSPNNGEVDT